LVDFSPLPCWNFFFFFLFVYFASSTKNEASWMGTRSLCVLYGSSFYGQHKSSAPRSPQKTTNVVTSSSVPQTWLPSLKVSSSPLPCSSPPLCSTLHFPRTNLPPSFKIPTNKFYALACTRVNQISFLFPPHLIFFKHHSVF